MVEKGDNDLRNQYICDDLFAGCSGITALTLPNSITSIRWKAFASECRRDSERPSENGGKGL